MENKKIGAILLSGLMIGPILGSGIIILPPLIFSIAGSWALLAWGIIVCLSFFFALIFGKLSILFPGDAGVSGAIESVFGREIKKLTSFYLIGAVLFGPVAVMLTAARYLPVSSHDSIIMVAGVLLIGCSFLLLRQIIFIGKISFVISSIAAATLFAGGITTLLFYRVEQIVVTPFDPNRFGYSLLLLFWTIVGWEVIGNYSADVKNPKKNIIKAVIVSAVIIAIVSLTVAAALQFIHPDFSTDRSLRLTPIITPLFGSFSPVIMAILTCSLCVTAYVLFAGGIARLISSLSEDGDLPEYLSSRTKTGSPIGAVLTLTTIHCLVLFAVYLKFAKIENLIELANGFFIGNVLIGISAAVKLLSSPVLKAASLLLIVIFSILLMQAAPFVIIIVLVMACYYFPKPVWLSFIKKSIEKYSH